MKRALFRISRYMFCTNLVRTQEESGGIFRQKVRMLKDRYELHSLTNIDFLCDVSKSTKYRLTLNENIILLYRLTQIFKILNKSIYYYMEFQNLVRKIIHKFQDPDDYACLGTFLLSLARLEMYSSQFWIDVTQFIIQRKYDDQFDEIFALIISLEDVNERVQNDWVREKVVQHYRQFKDVLILHIKQKKYNIKEIRKMCFCLYKYNFSEQDFWQEVHYWLRQTIGQLDSRPYEQFFLTHESLIQRMIFDEKIRPVPILEQLNEIAYFLTENNQPCLEFVQFAQKLITYAMKNGSQLFRRWKEQPREETPQYQGLGQYANNKTKHYEPLDLTRPYEPLFINAIELRNQHVIYFLQNFRRTLNEYREYPADPNIVRWISRLIVKEYNQYTIGELMKLYDGHEFLGMTAIKTKQFIMLKLKILRNMDVKFDDLKIVFDILGVTNMYMLQPVILRFAENSHPAVLLKLTHFLEAYIPYIPSYFLRLPTLINHHHKYYSFDENCYYFYTLITNEIYWKNAEKGLLEYEGEKEKLKETIKLSAFSRGFKITMDSYFHKLLEHINLAEFFEGGN